ncbi:Short-chain dehydrogenase/reductase SDR OS=Tsukamurella paurometabola (strain ATCC 8368 / DSM/ CCUG 35730 / CIP 100753 / JCM 10117 / KCTC 9821 / NBRC 16120/ NCIMB 702349 / NCTC 13040) OX=521096 GN=Tpau_1180 PE=3 SV=1 [Tsukamurella paurometabola]|uniref:Short-chain dehydrogenase/reductase SDR n=2 Tax=Tsukamurella paurometabola TaxID=2061 RepID=D5UW04_TSUPD|nr:short-chain dehydrogenase/reductase SDR [Tsukamurella paurometabola DSM 20162]SUP28844.1 NADP-dependent 3-hydroxy acid dehydrogenase YdfG [Tsukamurella paurometabola]
MITGASQGFGRDIAAEVLARGHTVIAIVRDSSRVVDLVAANPGRVEVVEADLAQQEGVDHAVMIARDREVGVLVNNAGRAICGAAEEVSMSDLRAQLELNFFAAAALTRAVLPGMRAQGYGTVVQLSSQGGRLSFPGVGAYSASKFALEGWSEALAGEVAPLGIRVMLVEPSRFRTGFNTTRSLGFAEQSGVYASTVGRVAADLAGVDGRQEGDPVRAARIIADIVASAEVPLRLPLGAEAVDRLLAAYTSGTAAVETWADVARSADFPSAGDRASRPV